MRRPARAWFTAVVLCLTVIFAFAGAASAETWLCPVCDARIERPPGAAALDCAQCGRSYDAIDLIPAVGYANSRTRDVEIPWVLQSPDCAIFRMDGLLAEDGDTEVWVPWTKIQYFIPRQRILRLLDGRELSTGYAKGPDTCVQPPKFALQVVDSVRAPGQAPLPRRMDIDEDLAALFFVAQTPEDRDSARVRFDQEVKAGKHPRLPRTPAILARAATVAVPAVASKGGWKGQTVLDVRTHDRGGVIEVRIVEPSGHAELDREAVRVAQASQYQSGGEMGVAVPSWLRLRITWEGATAVVTSEPSPLGVWGL